VGSSKYIGRVGALAVALGIGTAWVTTPGIAWADENASSNTDGPSQDTSGGDAPGTTNDVNPPTSTTGQDAGDHDNTLPTMGATTTTTTQGSSTITTVGGNGPTVTVAGSTNTGAIGAHDDAPAQSPTTTAEVSGETISTTTGAAEAIAGTPQMTPTATAIATAQQATPTTMVTTPTPSGSDTALTLGDPTTGTAALPAVTGTPRVFAARLAPTDTNTVGDTTMTLRSALVAPPLPVPMVTPPTALETVLAIPGTNVSTLLNLFTQALAPLIGPGAPADNPILWGLVAFVRRQFNEQFANSSPVLAPRQTSQDLDDAQVHGTFGGTDADGDTLAYNVPTTGLGAPGHGTVAMDQATGTWTYSPTAGYVGADYFFVTATDDTAGPHVHAQGQTHTAAARVDVTVAAVTAPTNTAPVSKDDDFSTAEDTALNTGNVLTNDTDADGNHLTATIVSGPAHAANFALNSDGTFAYTPAANYNGPDSFSYKASDGTATGNTATAVITVGPVNDAPTLSVTTEETGLPSGAIKVTITFADADGEILTSTIGPLEHGGLFSAPTGGIPIPASTVTGTTPAPTVGTPTTAYYIPDPTRPGTETLSFTLTDPAGGTVTKTAQIVVNGPTPAGNHAPTLTLGTEPTGLPNGAVKVTITFGDADADILTATVGDLAHGSLYADPTGGTPSLTGTTTSPGPVDPAGTTIVGYYIPDPARPGVDTLSVTLSDAYGGTVTRTKTLTVTTPVNQDPTGVVEAGEPDDNGVVLISVKVKDPEGDPVTVFYPEPETGTLEYLDQEDNDDGSFTQLYRYTPYAQSRIDASHTPGNDTETLAFDISDTDDDTSDFVTITTDVTISPVAATTVNHAPTATLTTTPTGAADGSLHVTVSVGEQDADIDTLTLSDPVHGTYVIDGQTQTTGFTSHAVDFGPTEQSFTFVYVPDHTRPGTETITFTITDAAGETATASQQVVVTPAPPSFTVTNHDTTTGVVTGTATVTDPQGRPLTYTVGTTQANGSFTVNATTGAWTYTPTATALAQSYAVGGTGTASFVITATNTTGDAVTVTVTVPVNVTTASLASMLQRQGSTPSAVAVGPTGVLYVTNSGANTLSVVDPTTNAITSTVHVGASPTAVSVGADGRVWVTNGADDTLTVLSDTGTTTDTTIGVGSSPTGLAFGADGSVYVANAGDGTISVINATTTTLDRTITLGGTPIGIAAGADGRIYVTDFTGNAIKVIDPTRGDALTTIDNAGPNPFGIAVSSAGTVYVTHPLNNTVSVLTPAAGNYIGRTVAVGASPTAIALGANGSIYVTDSGAGTVTVVDPHTFTTATIATGTNPNSITVGPEGNLYVTNGESDSLAFINSQNGSVTNISVGVDPNTVIIDAYGNVGVTSNYDNSVSVITHPATGTVSTGDVLGGTIMTGTVSGGTAIAGTATATGSTFQAGDNPYVVLSPDGNYAYAIESATYDDTTNRYVSDGTVTVINPATGTATTFHTGSGVTRLVVSPDSRVAYAYNDDGTVTTINPTTGSATTIHTGAGVNSIVVSPDSRYAYAYTYQGGGSVIVINSATGTATTIQTGTGVSSVVVSPDSRYAYAYGDDGTVAIINPTTGTATAIHTGVGAYTHLLVSPDSAYVYAYNSFTQYDYATRSYYFNVSIINPADGTATTIRTANPDGGWQNLVVGPNGRYAYAATFESYSYVTKSNHNTVSVINPAAGTSTVIAGGTGTGVGGIGIGTIDNSFLSRTGLVVSPDGRYVYANYGGGTVAIIRTDSNTVSAVNHPNVETYSNLVVSPDGRYAYLFNSSNTTAHHYDDSVVVINPATGAATTIRTGADVEVVKVSADGRYAYAYGNGTAVTVINPVTGTATTTTATATSQYLVVSPDSRYAYVIPKDNYPNGDTVAIINPADGTVTTVHTGMRTHYPTSDGSSVATVQAAPDGGYVYAYQPDGHVAIINPHTGTATVVRAGFSDLSGLKVSPDSRYALAISQDRWGVLKGVTAINPATGTTTTLATAAADSVMISPGGRYAYVIDDVANGGYVSVVDTTKLAFPSGSTAPDYSTSTYEDTPVVFDPTANPFVPPTGATVTGVSAPTNGIAVLNGSRITYTPNSGYTGTDTFTYTATNGVGTATGTISVQVDTVHVSVPYQAGPSGTQDLFSTLADAMDRKDLQHGVFTQHVLANGRESLIVYIAGTMEGFIGGDQAKIKNIPAASGIVDENQVAVIKAAMRDSSEPILLVGYSQGGLDAQNIAANAAQYGLQGQIKGVVTYGSPLVQPDKYPTVHLEDRADTVPKVNLFTPTNWIAGIINTVVNKNVFYASSPNDFDTGILTNFNTWGVHGVRSTYEDVGLYFDVDTSSHWDTVRDAMAGFLNGRVVPTGYIVVGGQIVQDGTPDPSTQF